MSLAERRGIAIPSSADAAAIMRRILSDWRARSKGQRGRTRSAGAGLTPPLRPPHVEAAD
jgi:hypothetical protein